jgi:predicted nucleic acid-binding protein
VILTKVAHPRSTGFVFDAVKLSPKDPTSIQIYQDRILPITEEIAEFWGTICPNDPLPEPDGLIAATALHHGMTLVTRNVEHVQRSGVNLLNPWENT